MQGSSYLADLALEEFSRRRANALRKMTSCAIDRPQAEALLRPWFALALRCGVPLAFFEGQRMDGLDDVDFDLQQLLEPLGERMARAVVADDICPRAVILRTLAIARDAALARAHSAPSPDAGPEAAEARIAASLRLSILAMAMGAPAPAHVPSTRPHELETA